eukprot:7126621-Karenia_brevis.AAC.1
MIKEESVECKEEEVVEMDTEGVMIERETEWRCQEMVREGNPMNRVMRECIGKGVAAEMVKKAKELTKEGVIVEARLKARQAVVAAKCKKMA